jgi:hypothetical protein
MAMNDKTEAVEKSDMEQTLQARKPYATPLLRVWGSMRDLTMSFGNAGSKDGGRGGSNKTG